MKRGIQDHSFITVFDKKHIPTIQNMIRKIRESIAYDLEHDLEHDGSISNYYLDVCQRNFDDHRNTVLEVGNQKVEFLQVCRSDPEDLVTTTGMNYAIDYWRGVQTTAFRYMGKGNGTILAASGDTTLAAEVSPRQYIGAGSTGFYGWGEWVGMSMRFAALWGEMSTQITIRESGIFTASSGGTMLAHDTYKENPATHNVYYSAYLISLIVDLVPRASPVYNPP